MMPTLTSDGLLIAGDAAALCLAAGIWLEGVNFAMASGMYAGEAVLDALRTGDTSVAGPRGLPAPARGHVRAQGPSQVAPSARSLVLSDRVQHLYPELATSVVERMFRVDNPEPKPGLRRIVSQERKRVGIRRRDLARDALDGLRSFG